MANEFNEVYASGTKKSELEEIKVEYVYLTIPSEWICTYHKLLVYLSDLGEDIVKNCNASCNNKNKNIISCWNLFQAAVASRQLGNLKQAEFFINYITEQLNLIYKDMGKDIYNGTHIYPISEDGRLKALCSCSENKATFKVDLETGKLYQEYLDDKVYTIEDENLVVESENKI